MVDEDDRISFFNLVKANGQDQFKVDLTKILFPHVLGGSSVVSDEHLRTICFGDYMHPEAEKKVFYYFIFQKSPLTSCQPEKKNNQISQ